MYYAEEVRERFISEVNRLVEVGAALNIFQMEKDCGIKQGRIDNICNKRTLLVNPEILVAVVTTYRSFDVSYEYIYEGKRPAQSYSAIKEELKRELIAYVQKI